MVRGLIWLAGALALAGLFLLALSGICGNPGSFPALSRYFCNRPLPTPLRPAPPGEPAAPSR